MRASRIVLAAVAAVALTSAGQSARAQSGGYGYGMGFWDVGNLYRVLADRVPYYAAFPPVYYSMPVPRTYGHSPFAYLPTHETPEIEQCTPVAIVNPYYRGHATVDDSAPAAVESNDRMTSQSVASEPLVIHNPFYRPRGEASGPEIKTAVLQR